jgi:cytochrome c oxidase subunit 4
MKENEHAKTDGHRHIIGYGVYVLVWLALLAFTALTVSASGIHFGGATLIIALVIAIVKSSLVLNYFMHIKYDDIIFKVYIALGIFTLLSAIIGTFSDYLFR